MCEGTHVQNHAYANKSRCMYIRDVCKLSNPANGKPLAAIAYCKFLSASSKLRIGKTLATNGEEITIAMIGNDILANYW